jgi:DNA adenine methylase
MMVTRPILRYHGGKWRLAPWIISHFPRHRVYTEAFGGGASILLRKPRTYAEVYNDLDDEVVNVFRVLRDGQQARELERLVALTPYARTEFEESYLPSGDPVEQARRTILRSMAGFGSAAVSKAHKTGFRASSNRSGTTPARDWVNYPPRIRAFVERLQGVVIERKDAAEVILQHDSKDTLHYVDPPYVWDTRRTGSGAWNDAYRYEMTDSDHEDLSRLLRSVKGMVVLSGYASPLYDEVLYTDWKRVECATIKSTNNASAPATEVLWLNDAAARKNATLFGEAA